MRRPARLLATTALAALACAAQAAGTARLDYLRWTCAQGGEAMQSAYHDAIASVLGPANLTDAQWDAIVATLHDAEAHHCRHAALFHAVNLAMAHEADRSLPPAVEDETFHLLEQATRDEDEGWFELAVLLTDPKGRHYAPDRGVAALEHAAAQRSNDDSSRSAEAARWLAVCYERGLPGLPRDAAKAAHWRDVADTLTKR